MVIKRSLRKKQFLEAQLVDKAKPRYSSTKGNEKLKIPKKVVVNNNDKKRDSSRDNDKHKDIDIEETNDEHDEYGDEVDDENDAGDDNNENENDEYEDDDVDEDGGDDDDEKEEEEEADEDEDEDGDDDDHDDDDNDDHDDEYDNEKSAVDEDDDEAVEVGSLPAIAIIGRPNTGKSTLVNKITDSYRDGGIVHDEPGITRDRSYRLGYWCGYNFQVIDTGGILFDDTKDLFTKQITQQALIALKEAACAVLVVDGQEGLTPQDMEIAQWLKKNKRDVPVYVAVNKCESAKLGRAQAEAFTKLGLGTPYPVSGIHGKAVV